MSLDGFFGPLSRFADNIEERYLPRWFRWNGGGGDFVSWIHHTLWALVFAGFGVLIGWMAGEPVLGAKGGSLMALAFYLLRESISLVDQWGDPGMWWRGRPHWTGYLPDAVMDCVGPALVAWMFW